MTDYINLYKIDEKDIHNDLDISIRKGLVECFPADAEYFSRQSWWNSRPEWRVLAADNKEEITGHIAVVIRDVLVGKNSEPVKVAGIQSVFVRPEMQGTGLSDKLMKKTMQVAYDKGIDTGFLFCMPGLEKIYDRMGWKKIDVNVFMKDEKGNTVPIPGKNIAMVYPLKRKDFPSGNIDLAGPDW